MQLDNHILLIPNPCVSIKSVSKSFGQHQVLFDINLDIPYSRIVGLLGPSGSGKTTLVKMIAGIETPTKGEIQLLDTKMPNLKTMNKIGYMGQSDALYEDLTAQENLDFFASMYSFNKAKRKEKIQEVMELVNLSGDLKKQVKYFSGGMKRRLSLAIALIDEPPVLILDEPTVGIDPILRNIIWDQLYALCRKGTTIIVTTHVMDEADKCHTLGMIREGVLLAVGTPAELKSSTGADTLEGAFIYYGTKSGGNLL